ncbi:glycosyltransferase family 4 protein [uncultured Alistipes sp.]|uniref:glycosyltransferase family 4 protein n=1 Tax=uncultured Alistipes sp. TaxID=538949 RepID=UPI0032B12AB6
MNILLVSFYYTPELGAAPARIANMADGFGRLGDRVDVLTCLPNYPKGRIFDGYRRRLYKRERIGGCNVYRYWSYVTVSKNPLLRGISLISFAVNIWLFAFRRRLIKSYDCVIIQSPPLPIAGSAVALFKCLYRKKTILNISDLWPLSAVELGAMKEGSLIHKWFSRIERFIYKRADAVLGQSEEILNHVAAFESSGKRFLYRNLQQYDLQVAPRRKGEPFRIVYAGLLGVAQNMLAIIENIDFKALGVEFHLYGGGNQAREICAYIDERDCNVFYHGYVAKERIGQELVKYDASLVPLTVRIRGAVPSKIFDIVPLGVPVLFCGGGEGAEIVEKYGIGLISAPGDYETLKENISSLAEMSDSAYGQLSANCIETSRRHFDFEKQMARCRSFIGTVCGSESSVE